MLRKFVRGDAIAGIIIMFINVVGGLIVGVCSTTWSWPGRQNYTLLTIGDGLVARFPADCFHRGGYGRDACLDDRDIGKQVMGQMFGNPKAMASPPPSSVFSG